MRRWPSVAGQFYPGEFAKLNSMVERLVYKRETRYRVKGVVSPHAGLMYSGAVAGAIYSEIVFPETFILIGPNHTGLGPRASIMADGEWEIPTGTFTINEILSRRLIKDCTLLKEDVNAHLYEHSLEVQLPFIAYFASIEYEGRLPMIVPVILGRLELEECKILGESIAETIRKMDVTIVASSDMSHYIPERFAREKDRKAIERILAIDPEGLYNIVLKEGITMCGFIPATVMLFAMKALGAREAKLIKYMTSGDVSGDYDHVVGYAGIVIN